MTAKAMYIGTSGWHYAHWRGCYYPEGLSSREWLPYYAQQFSCVELNNSFYKLPNVSTVKSWCEQTPKGFLFSVKASRLMTHMKKLRNCADVLDTFLSTVDTFGKKLGPILFQLPPRWHANPERLQQFLNDLPRRHRYTFEFRDLTWHTEAIYELLASHNAAFCQFDLQGFHSPNVVTADFVYVRLHGPDETYAGSYPRTALRKWAKRIRGWESEGKQTYVFFDNDQAGYAVQNALMLQDYCHVS